MVLDRVLRTLLRRALFGTMATVGALALLEGAARVGILIGLHTMLPPDVVEWITARPVVFDPALGWRPQASVPAIRGGNFKLDAFELDAQPRTPGELRGYAFGDSQTHGAGVAESRAWPSVTERALRDAGLNVRVINLGSSGYRSAQVLRLIETYAAPHHPDFLIVDCMANDSDPLPRDYGQQWASVRGFLFQSRLYRLLSLGVAKARGMNTGPAAAVTIEQPPAPAAGPGVRGPVLAAGNHAAILALAQAEHIPVVFVDYPFLGFPIQSLAPAQELPPGAVVAPVTAALRRSPLPPQDLFLENNHLSVAGSEIVGRTVADTLRAQLGK